MAAKKKLITELEIHSGYNEKNPTQPHGAFEPDNKTKGEKPTLTTSLPKPSGPPTKKV